MGKRVLKTAVGQRASVVEQTSALNKKGANDRVAEVTVPARTPAVAARQALAHFAAVLGDPKASAARKDKAARLILTHTAKPAKSKRDSAAAAAPSGKKEQQRADASQAAAKPGKWTGLLQ